MASSHSVCGDFDAPTFVDYGQCHPRRLKRDCRSHVPSIPGFPDSDTTPPEGCVDDNAVAVFDSDETPPNRTLVSIFDEDCEAVLDENGDPILGALV